MKRELSRREELPLAALSGLGAPIEIRSYRRVFALERRLYRIDRLRLNPSGVPLRGIAYFMALLVVALLARRLPLAGGAVGIMPWYLRDALGPAMVAAACTMLRIEGRPFHIAAPALVRYALGCNHHAGVRPCPSVGTRWRVKWSARRQGARREANRAARKGMSRAGRPRRKKARGPVYNGRALRGR